MFPQSLPGGQDDACVRNFIPPAALLHLFYRGAYVKIYIN